MSALQLTPSLGPCPGQPPAETAVVRNPSTPIRSAVHQSACLVQIYPVNAALGRCYLLSDPVVLGRDEDCAICIDEASVSRNHARLVARDEGYYVADLRSTNGTFVNDHAVLVQKLADGDYLRVGNHIFRFLAGGNIEADYHEEIYRLTVTDALTGAFNHRFLLEFLERELARSLRHGRPLSLVLFDIDHFKAVNDVHGHLAGDQVLRGLAARLGAGIRRDELFARYGGEEFAIVLPETTRPGTLRLAERMRELAVQPFESKGQRIRVSISLGTTTTDGKEVLTPLEFIGRADENLYAAKRNGRNCVVG